MENKRKILLDGFQEFCKSNPIFLRFYNSIRNKISTEELQYINDVLISGHHSANGIKIWLDLLAHNVKTLSKEEESDYLFFQYFYIQFYEFLTLDEYFQKRLQEVADTSEFMKYDKVYIDLLNEIVQAYFRIKSRIPEKEYQALEYFRNQASHPILGKYFVQQKKNGYSFQTNSVERTELRRNIGEIVKKYGDYQCFVYNLIEQNVIDFQIIKENFEKLLQLYTTKAFVEFIPAKKYFEE